MYPAGEPGVSVQHVTVDDGLRLRVIECGPARDDAVLLVHGWGGSVYSFSEMIPALAAAGHRAIAIDLPGHGLSDKPTDDKNYSTRALSDAVMSAANAMGVRRFAFVGHSMGGALGLDLATRGERRLDRLVLINSVGLGTVRLHPLVKLSTPRIVNRIVPKLLTRATVTLILRLAFGTRDRPRKRDIDEYWAPTQFDEFAWACRACIHRLTWRRVSATKLRSLRIPVLVISGARDVLVRRTAERAKLIPGARIVSMREGGHIVLQDCAPATNEEIMRFLQARDR
jgi:pimeloyl-ACP methyl ester carboxylesterase